MTEPTPLPTRFYSLDALRGLAALAVVHTHWVHFFVGGTGDETFVRQRLPFHRLLGPLYSQGWRAVDLFFCLSGFIFTWLYAQRIAERRIGAGEFSLLRFSRLYPLHLATLLFVAVGQWAMRSRFGSNFVVVTNDAYHFVLNVFFLSGLGLERDGSFNAPVWSVSVEVFVYVVFFVVCAFGLRRWWVSGVLALIGFGLEFTHCTAIGRGLLSFFTGALAFHLYLALRKGGVRVPTFVLLSVPALAWLFAAANLRYGLILRAARVVLGSQGTILGYEPGYFLLHHAFQWLPFQVLPFPATIVALALLESARGTLGRRLAFLGDISYSSYLLHFPLQLTFAFAALSCGLPRAVFYSPIAYFLFFLTLLLLSLLTYRSFERPMQSALRQSLSRSRSG